MEDFLKLILEPLKELFLKFKEFVPNLLAMLVILLVGIIIARVIKLALVKFLIAIKFDVPRIVFQSIHQFLFAPVPAWLEVHPYERHVLRQCPGPR